MAKGKNNLRHALKDALSDNELKSLKTAFDMVGDIAIIEIDQELNKREKIIGKTLLDLHNNIKVVCKKEGIHEGEFRTQKMKVIAGENRKTTIHKENGCVFKVNVEKAYFSPRLSTERKRIFQKVKENEDVLVMFSGVGPYPITIEKNANPASITAIEKNPEAHKLAIENVKLNKITKTRFICGDARDEAKKLGKFDRILMPLPRGGEDFLPTALKKARDKSVIHFYDFLHESELMDARKKVLRAVKAENKRFRTLEFRKCGQSGPRFYRVVLDFKVIEKIKQ